MKSRLIALVAAAAWFLVFVPVVTQMPAEAGTPGVDGALTVTAANTVVNSYDFLITATAGQRTFTVSNAANLALPAAAGTARTPLGPGSVVMLYQANGATIDSTDTATYGNITNYNNAGYYEFVTVGSVAGNTITIAASCNAISHTYATNGSTGLNEAEVVRVPQFSSLTINSGASITATPWTAKQTTTTGSATYGAPANGEDDGGIVAIDVSGTTTISGSINVTGDGFLGGDGYQDSGASAPGNHAQPITDTVFAGETGGDLASALGAMKGESIAGNQATLDGTDGGRYGRGAPANGGGGGNGHNNGGGGGANGNNGNTWFGVGILDSGQGGGGGTDFTTYYSDFTGATKNNFNPTGGADAGGFSATGVSNGQMTTDSGGGRGGYSYYAPKFGVTPDYNEGGLGGRPLTATSNARIFFGGGGGAGDENNGAGGFGGTGGGIVVLNSGTVAGGGTIVANGGAGGTGSGPDAGGGGGGGGSVVILTAGTAGVTVNANGGTGGNSGNGEANNEADGTGGGGGGGYVAANATAKAITGGNEGIEITGSIDAAGQGTNPFLPFGATLGATGLSQAGPTSFTYCYTPVIGAAKAATVVNNKDGTYNVTYSVVLENYGDTALTTLAAMDNLATTFPTGTTYTILTAPAVTTSTGSTATVDAGFNGSSDTNLVTAGTLPISGLVTVTFTVKVTPPAGTQTYNNSATTSANGVTGNSAGVATTDTSDNGTNPDPAGFGVPNQTAENVVTPVTILGVPPVTKTVQDITATGTSAGTANTSVPGHMLQYVLSFTNTTGQSLSGFSFADTVPANTKFVSATCISPTVASGTCTPPATAANAVAGTALKWTFSNAIPATTPTTTYSVSFIVQIL